MQPLRFDAGLLCRGLVPAVVALPEYAEPYRVLRLAADAPLRVLLAAAPLLVADVPSDLRARAPAFAALTTSVTAPRHSQPPHQDHPHRPGDPRRHTLFWAETARGHAHTFFAPAECLHEVAATLTAWLRGNTLAATAAAHRIALFREAPLRVSRYALPPGDVEAFAGLVGGEAAAWSGLHPLAQTTVTTRLLGNTEAATHLTRHVLTRLGDRAFVERWERPRVVIADDRVLLHGRLGRGDSGAGFFRIWLDASA